MSHVLEPPELPKSNTEEPSEKQENGEGEHFERAAAAASGRFTRRNRSTTFTGAPWNKRGGADEGLKKDIMRDSSKPRADGGDEAKKHQDQRAQHLQHLGDGIQIVNGNKIRLKDNQMEL